jgi:hypothetical protein
VCLSRVAAADANVEGDNGDAEDEGVEADADAYADTRREDEARTVAVDVPSRLLDERRQIGLPSRPLRILAQTSHWVAL